MRKFDHDGLLLAEYQGKLFERSSELDCSTGVFIRRFLHSDLLKKLDANDPAYISLDVNEGIDDIIAQFGESDYGKNKFAQSALFWMGYIYRYIAYTREESTKYIVKLFDYRQLNDLFLPFHTQDPEWCVRNLLEINNLSEDVFDKNERLKRIMEEKASIFRYHPTLTLTRL